MQSNVWRLKLDNNENVYGCSKNIISAMKNLNYDDILNYSENKKPASKLASLYSLSEDNFFFFQNRFNLFDALAKTFLKKDSEFLLCEIYAQNLKKIFINSDFKVEYFSYDNDFRLDINSLKQKITQNTKLIYLPIINETTGELLRPSLIKNFLSEFKNTLFVLDCEYINFSYNVSIQDCFDLLDEFNNVIIIKSFEKDYALGSLSVNFLCANSNLVQEIKKHTFEYYNVASNVCVVSSLNDNKFIEETKELNSKTTEFFFQELNKKGFLPIESQGNFLLCDFGMHCDFYYSCFKKNGILTKKFPKNSVFKNCLRFTTPKLGGVKYILELLNKKDLLIFDLDHILFDIENSYIAAIKKFIKLYADKEISHQEIFKIKTMGNTSSNILTIDKILKQNGVDFEFAEIQEKFLNILFEKDNNNISLIEKEKPLILLEDLKEISQKFDLAILSSRTKKEIQFLLERHFLSHLFSCIISSDDLSEDELKPNSKGIQKLLELCPCKKAYVLGSSVDDIIAANSSQIESIGVFSKNLDFHIMQNNFRHLGVMNVIENIADIKSFLLDM